MFDHKMWSSILQRHFPKSSWKKHYTKIIFYTLSVLRGLKPSLLWDFGSPVTPQKISNFLRDFKTFFEASVRVLVITVRGDILVTNAPRCLDTAGVGRLYVEVDGGTCRLMSPEEGRGFGGAIALLESKFKDCEDCEVWELPPSISSTCVPCLFGILLDYPVVYYFRGDYQPFPVDLRVYTLSCRCGLLKEGAFYFRKSLSVRPHFLRALRNLDNVSNMAVERWHFRMLNDNHRNEAYRKAIIKKIRRGVDKVLDVGTGTGILSLFCREGGAEEIYTCDSSSVMIEIANEVFEKNNATGIKVLNKHSTELALPADVPERVGLVVTETLDSGLLGEGILSTLIHAWDNLLRPPLSPGTALDAGHVIPLGATMYLTGIECDEVSKSSYLSDTKWWRCDGAFAFQSCEEYDSRDLKRVPFKLLTNVVKVIAIDFNDPKMLKEIASGAHDGELKLSCRRPGRLDCFAAWFDLHLDEDITLTTSPLSEENEAWDQAIFLLPNATTLEPGQEIQVDVSFKSGKLDVKSRGCYTKHFEPTEELIRTFNDEILSEALAEVASKPRIGPLRILDCFRFPVFGFNYLTSRRRNSGDQLTCVVRGENDRDLIEFLAESCDLKVVVALQSEFPRDEDKSERFDVILVDPADANGELEDGSRAEELGFLLKPGGVVLPEEVSVLGQFVYCDWLDRTSRVISDEVTCGYHIKDFINAYKSRHHVDLDWSAMDKTISSKPFHLFGLSSPETRAQMTVPLLSPTPPPNALLYYFGFRFAEDCREFFTNDEACLRHQAAFLLVDVKPAPEIKFNVIRNSGLFNIQILQS